MKIRTVVFREDVRMPGVESMKLQFSDATPPGLEVDFDRTNRLIVLRLKGYTRCVPLELVRWMDPIVDDPKAAKANKPTVREIPQ